MIFRGKQPEAVIWRRFRSGLDGFTFAERGDPTADGDTGYYTAHVVANAERVLDLLHSFSELLGPAVDVAIEDRRTGRTWHGESVALPDVRDTVARLKLPLATYGGVELSIYTADDQLTLTPWLELFTYARTDRWLYVLLGKGLVEQESLPSKAWLPDGVAFPPAPELEHALRAAVQRLALVPA